MIIILNGPAGCGKDTLANILKQRGWATSEFKHTMFAVAVAMSGMEEADFMRDYNNREVKEAPQKHLGGMSYRQFMIHISEAVMKPIFGDNVFGLRSAEKCILPAKLGLNIVFSDGGFIDEVRALHNFGYEVVVVRLRREGFSFDGDSREYLYPDFCSSFDVQLTDGSPYVAVHDILEGICK